MPFEIETIPAIPFLAELREKVLKHSLKRMPKWKFRFAPDIYMHTRYDGRERPSLVVKDWVRFGEGGNLVLPAPDKPVLTGSAAAPVEPKPTATSNPLGMHRVEPPTAKEVTGDEIPW